MARWRVRRRRAGERAATSRVAAGEPGLGVGLRNVSATSEPRGRAGRCSRPASPIRPLLRRRRNPLRSRPPHHRSQPADLRRRRFRRANRPDPRRAVRGDAALTGQGLSARSAWRRGPLSAHRHRRDANGARTPGDSRSSSSAASSTRASSSARAARSSGTPSSPVSPAAISSSSGPGSASILAAAPAPRSSSPRGGAACPSGSPPTRTSAPEAIRAAMQGQVNNIGFRFAQPAEIAGRRVWRLPP